MLPSPALRSITHTPTNGPRPTVSGSQQARRIPVPIPGRSNDPSALEAPSALRSYGRYYSTGYDDIINFTSWTFACMDERAKALASIENKVYRNDTTTGQTEREEVWSEHWLVNLLTSPNAYADWATMIYLASFLCDGNGNTYLYTPCENGSPVPTAIYLLPSHGMMIEGGTERGKPLVERYTYNGLGGPEHYDPHEICHIRHPYPWREGFKMMFVGRSIIRAALKAVAIDAHAQEFLANYFEGGTIPPFAIEHPGQMDNPQWDNFTKRFRETYEDVRNGRFMFLEDGAHINPIHSPGREKELNEIDIANRKRICSVFKTPEVLLTMDHPNRATAEVTEYAFKTRFANTEWGKWTRSLTRHFAYYEKGIEVDFDKAVNAYPELIQMERQFLINIGYPRNKVLAEMGRDEVPGGDVPMVEQGVIPLSMAIEGGGLQNTQGTLLPKITPKQPGVAPANEVPAAGAPAGTAPEVNGTMPADGTTAPINGAPAQPINGVAAPIQ
jgi:HK97 family phage portal protein